MVRPRQAAPDLSLLIAFGNCEESAGRYVRAAAAYLRDFGRSFQIIAVNEGSRDNSVAVLQLLAADLPELTIVTRDCSGRAFARGVLEAQADTLILTASHADAEIGPWASLGWAMGRLDRGRDAVINRGRYVVARRQSCLPAIGRVRGHSRQFHRWLESTDLGLRVEAVGTLRPESSPSALRTLLSAPLRRLAAVSRW